MYDLGRERQMGRRINGPFPLLSVPLPPHLQRWAEWGKRLIMGWPQGAWAGTVGINSESISDWMRAGSLCRCGKRFYFQVISRRAWMEAITGTLGSGRPDQKKKASPARHVPTLMIQRGRFPSLGFQPSIYHAVRRQAGTYIMRPRTCR